MSLPSLGVIPEVLSSVCGRLCFSNLFENGAYLFSGLVFLPSTMTVFNLLVTTLDSVTISLVSNYIEISNI